MVEFEFYMHFTKYIDKTVKSTLSPIFRSCCTLFPKLKKIARYPRVTKMEHNALFRQFLPEM